jgi:large subunit ribosomal protein L31
MKEGIHPDYVAATIVCACGNTVQTRSTKQSIRLEICSKCHPFFTGTQKLIDSAGRVERFEKRFAKTAGETVKKTAPVSKAAKGQSLVNPAKKTAKVLSTTPIVKPKKPGEKFSDKGAAKTAEKSAKPADKPAAKAH